MVIGARSLQRVVARASIRCGVHRQRADVGEHDGVAVGRALDRRSRRRCCRRRRRWFSTTTCWPRFSRQELGDDARHGVGAAAGLEADHHGDRLGRKRSARMRSTRKTAARKRQAAYLISLPLEDGLALLHEGLAAFRVVGAVEAFLHPGAGTARRRIPRRFSSSRMMRLAVRMVSGALPRNASRSIRECASPARRPAPPCAPGPSPSPRRR